MAEPLTPARKSRRRTRIVLVISLALNLLVAGLTIGALIGGGRHDHRDPRDTEALRALGNVPFVMALEKKDRALLLQGLGGRDGALRENRDRLRDRFERVLALLRADAFDPEGLRAVLAEQREALFERQKLGEELLLARLAGMSAEERSAYADRLDRSLRRGPRKDPPRR